MPRYVEFVKSASLSVGEVTSARSTESFVGGYLALSGTSDVRVQVEGAVGEGGSFTPTESDWIPVQQSGRFERLGMVPTLTRLRVLSGTLTRAVAEYYTDINLVPKENLRLELVDTQTRSALSNTALADLAGKDGSAGPQFLAGSRWSFAEDGTPNGGTVVAGSGGVWVRENPDYSSDEFGGNLSALLSAVPAGRVADFRTGGVLTAGLISTAESPITGRGIYAPLSLDPSAAASTDVLTIRPPADGNQRAGMWVRDLLLVGTNGRNALRVDLTGAGRRMTRFSMHGVHMVAGTGRALDIENEQNEIDAISTSYISECAFMGGVRINGGGDSLKISDSIMSGTGGLQVSLNTKNVSGGGADASQLMLDNINCTLSEGFYLKTGTRTRMRNWNMELNPGDMGVPGHNAMVYWQGGAGADEFIEGGDIQGGYYGVSTAGAVAFKFGRTKNCQLSGVTIGVGTDTYAVHITAETKNFYLGPNNVYVCTPGYEVLDQGLGTMGVARPLTLLGSGRLASVTPNGNRGRPQFIKLPAGPKSGIVTVTGAFLGGTLAKDDLIATLDEGYRPAAGTYPRFAVPYRTDTTSGVTTVTVNPTGEITLDALLPGATILEFFFNGITFEAANL